MSTSIKLFEKIVEPILTYNCEVSLTDIPNKWDYSKFVVSMWEHAGEINKVSMNFLRQILGVHKKSSNVALMSETGKYPIVMKVYYLIYKYWIRIRDSENPLLKEALATNLYDHNQGRNTWYRIITYLQKITEANIGDPKEEISRFRDRIKFLFQLWWEKETKNRSKLDFYFSLKKHFGFESYLDNQDIKKEARIATTKLRLSSHCLPVEVLRYCGRDRQDRTCNICPLNKAGDENHYLAECENKGMADVRENFLTAVKNMNPQLENFSTQNIIIYCLGLKDTKFQGITANFISDLFKQYKKESNLPPLKILCLRYMGKIRNPQCRKITR